MKEHSEHWLSSKLMSNIKYWLLGSFISFNAGWAVVIIVCILDNCFPDKINPYIAIPFICFGPFIGTLIIKLIEKNLPLYFYITTGLIYGITFCCFTPVIEHFIDGMYQQGIKLALYYLSFYKEKESPIAYDNYIAFISIFCLASFLGGFTVDIYRYFKGRNSEPSSHLYE